MTHHYLKYAERAKLCKNTLAQNLFNLLDIKKTNLALSADIMDSEKLIFLAEEMGSEICILKTHIDILQNFNFSVIDKLQELARKHHFFIFEDRKFADIGNTVKQQYAGGVYRIADWADIVNAHSLPGSGIIKSLAEVGRERNRALLLVAEMSSAGNLLDAVYAERTLEMATDYPEFVIGFISQRKLSLDPHWIYMTPGVQLESSRDELGQQYITPDQAIAGNGCDIIIVGRGILSAENTLKAAQMYRQAGWRAYEG